MDNVQVDVCRMTARRVSRIAVVVPREGEANVWDDFETVGDTADEPDLARALKSVLWLARGFNYYRTLRDELYSGDRKVVYRVWEDGHLTRQGELRFGQ
jgi:hypothetical protein